MSYLIYNTRTVPTGFRKLLYLNWGLIVLICAVACVGFVMLYSLAGGSAHPWMKPQVERFATGIILMVSMAMVPIWFWRNISVIAYLVGLCLLIGVEINGFSGGGAQRWIDLGFMQLQLSTAA